MQALTGRWPLLGHGCLLKAMAYKKLLAEGPAEGLHCGRWQLFANIQQYTRISEGDPALRCSSTY